MLKYNNIVDVHGRKYVLGPTQAHFNPSVARAKMSAEKGPKHIYAEEHQLYYYYYNFETRTFCYIRNADDSLA